MFRIDQRIVHLRKRNDTAPSHAFSVTLKSTLKWKYGGELRRINDGKLAASSQEKKKNQWKLHSLNQCSFFNNYADRLKDILGVSQQI